ncbi:MAG: DUF116 domain-containing protein [Thermodesulfovibrionales bacterium]|nr:DUF116 domain-containing protein [Thermodesulfovibrionales bacterium]
MTTLVRALLLKLVYPILMLFGGISQSLREKFQRFIINANNRLVKSNKITTKKILILIPHCIQVNACNIRVTNDIYNCKRCGNCGISRLIELADENGLKLFIATGGSMARKILKDFKPDAVVAVACERDLSSGIVDSFPLPVLGIFNQRPEGPCFNTQVDIDKVREAIEFFGRAR